MVSRRILACLCQIGKRPSASAAGAGWRIGAAIEVPLSRLIERLFHIFNQVAMSSQKAAILAVEKLRDGLNLRVDDSEVEICASARERFSLRDSLRE